jgi:hypothetical protein
MSRDEGTKAFLYGFVDRFSALVARFEQRVAA